MNTASAPIGKKAITRMSRCRRMPGRAHEVWGPGRFSAAPSRPASTFQASNSRLTTSSLSAVQTCPSSESGIASFLTSPSWGGPTTPMAASGWGRRAQVVTGSRAETPSPTRRAKARADLPTRGRLENRTRRRTLGSSPRAGSPHEGEVSANECAGLGPAARAATKSYRRKPVSRETSAVHAASGFRLSPE